MKITSSSVIEKAQSMASGGMAAEAGGIMYGATTSAAQWPAKESVNIDVAAMAWHDE